MKVKWRSHQSYAETWTLLSRPAILLPLLTDGGFDYDLRARVTFAKLGSNFSTIGYSVFRARFRGLHSKCSLLPSSLYVLCSLRDPSDVPSFLSALSMIWPTTSPHVLGSSKMITTLCSISSSADIVLRDLDAINAWHPTWPVPLNVPKCLHIACTRSRHRPVRSYPLGTSLGGKVVSPKYLGVRPVNNPLQKLFMNFCCKVSDFWHHTHQDF